MARPLQSGPANMTDGFKFNRGSQQMKREVERKQNRRHHDKLGFNART
jgi:hypothetical protein